MRGSPLTLVAVWSWCQCAFELGFPVLLSAICVVSQESSSRLRSSLWVVGSASIYGYGGAGYRPVTSEQSSLRYGQPGAGVRETRWRSMPHTASPDTRWLTSRFSDRDELAVNVFRLPSSDLESKWGTGAFNCRFSEANFLLISLRCSKVGSEGEKHNNSALETAENKE